MPTKETAILFDGVTGIEESARITAGSSPDGAFEEVVELDADGAGLFSGSEVIPVPLWRPLCDQGGWETFVRAENPAGTGFLVTFDDEALTGVSGQECVEDRLAAGDYLGALFECASPASPVARVHAAAGGTGPTTIEGDVVIDSPADADGLECVQTIVGSLTIDDGVVQDLSLPSLQEVTGDVHLVFERGAGVFPQTETIHLPALHTVRGDVALHSPAPAGGQTMSHDFGLNALTSIGGDLSIQVDAFNCTPSGFDALAAIEGNVTYDSCSQDGSGSGLLPALASIGGDLDVTFGTSTQLGYFNSLQTVDGDLIVRNGAWPPSLGGTGSMFNSLTTVTGTLHAIDVFIPAAPTHRAFDSLAEAGTLDWDSGGTMQDIGATAVAIGGLRFNDNDWLTELTTLMSKYTIAPDAPITITNNASLPQCDAQAWVDALADHTGPVVISGNLTCGRAGEPTSRGLPR